MVTTTRGSRMRGLNFIKNILALSVVALLSACSITKETFDCSYGKGVGCRSITEVNTMVNNGNLVGANSTKTSKLAVTPAASIKSEVISSDKMVVNRVTEQHLRIWIAPHQDEHGHFHEGAVVHTVLRSGFWKIT